MKSDARKPHTRIWVWLALLLALGAGLRYMTHMPGSPHAGPLPPLSGTEAELRKRLAGHIGVLAGDIGERNLWRYEALRASADYIEKAFQAMGYRVASQPYVVQGKTVRNLEATLPGASAPDEIVVIGAHYDSVVDSPGANDNASGVAALLEIARLLAQEKPARSVRLVAFVNEEPPFFYTQDMGSRVYARRARERGENIVAMLSLETIGYYTDAKGSQRYPFPFSLFYPDTANFIAFVGNLASRELAQACVAAFRSRTAFPSEGLAAPGWMEGISWSDQWSFWQEGYPAIMVTDTAPYRYAHYHARTDTPDKIEYERLARVVAGLARVVLDLAAKVEKKQ
jgi:Zn-dependent M28 family amino/carboxypeptidase